MNPAVEIALVLMMGCCCGLPAVRANIADRGYVGGGHLSGGHGPNYRKISLIHGGGGGGGLLRPPASASIASTASVSVPGLLHGHRKPPVLATYHSRSGPGFYGLHGDHGNHHGSSYFVDRSGGLLRERLLAAKNSRHLGAGCGGETTGLKCLQLVGPTCCNKCGGCGGVHY